MSEYCFTVHKPNGNPWGTAPKLDAVNAVIGKLALGRWFGRSFDPIGCHCRAKHFGHRSNPGTGY
jgi:hypothetical protein